MPRWVKPIVVIVLGVASGAVVVGCGSEGSSTPAVTEKQQQKEKAK